MNRLGANGACLGDDRWREAGHGLGHSMKEAEKVGCIQDVNSSL